MHGLFCTGLRVGAGASIWANPEKTTGINPTEFHLLAWNSSGDQFHSSVD